VNRDDDQHGDAWDPGLFRHPVPRRSRGRLVAGLGGGRSRRASPSLVAGVGLLVLIVGGAFGLAPPPPAILFFALERPEQPVDHLPPGSPMIVAVDLRQDGYPALFALGPDGYLRWLYPPESGPEPYRQATAGRRTYFADHGFRPRLPGAWLFVHFLHDRPVTSDVQQAVIGRLRSHRLWHGSPFELAPEFERILGATFREVIVQPFTVSPSMTRHDAW